MSGCVQWLSFENQHSSGGTEQAGAQYGSVSACQEFCAQKLSCVAVDFNFNYRSCWIHNDRARLKHMNHAANVTQYRIIRGPILKTTANATGTTGSNCAVN